VELKHIKELMAAMERTGTKKLSFKRKDFELSLEREEKGNAKPFALPVDPFEEEVRAPLIRNRADQALSRGSDLPTGPVSSPIAEASKEDVAGSYITSPMVGTFYTSPSPEDPSFVKVGDKVEKHTVVCIIEAMKVMNEIKAGITGTVAEVLVETGQPVEFGTKLFRII
jgi:acetyl-CoA carboxylase biotin carboxyl carrier protein